MVILSSKARLPEPKKDEFTVPAKRIYQELSHPDDPRTIYIELPPDNSRAKVIFTGDWTGKHISAAYNAIVRAYKSRRRIATK